MSGCRIGRVKLKVGGEIHKLPVPERDEVQRNIVSRAAMIAGFYEPGDLAGYVVFGWGRDGSSSIAYSIDEDAMVGVRMLPSFVADAVREKAIEVGDWG
ncbi:hypothetical protein G6L12_05860 [Agrobacterium rhizogenes]|nr:hypothetical protein [Rhizobium rhizogenes]NTF74000.1 hypothetical protein [Rhizobium rhizogenes]